MTTTGIGRIALGVAGISAALTVSTSAFAFGGCVDSPENPTWILAGIGVVAAGAPWLRARIKARRRNGKHRDD